MDIMLCVVSMCEKERERTRMNKTKGDVRVTLEVRVC